MRSFSRLAVFALPVFGLAACSAAASGLENPRGKIVYTAPSGDLWTMNADGSHRRRLTHSGPATDYSPSWSSDGRRVVFRTERGKYVRDPNGSGAQGVFVINSNGTHERQIQPRTGGLFPALGAYGAHDGDGNWAVWIMNADGSGQRQLTHPQLVEPAGTGGDYPIQLGTAPDPGDLRHQS